MPRKNLPDYTSIHVTKKLARRLNKIRQAGESYEGIIWRLLWAQEQKA